MAAIFPPDDDKIKMPRLNMAESFAFGFGLCGFEIHVDDVLMSDRVWQFPTDRFIEYGPEDEWWARKYGFGREVSVPKREVYRVGWKLIMHSAVAAELKKEIKEVGRNRQPGFLHKSTY